MARLRVNPTRMELMRLKRRLRIAVHGHSLLEDKLEGLMNEFRDLIARYGKARQELDAAYPAVVRLFVLAAVTSSRETIEGAVAQARGRLTVKASQRNLLSVRVPHFEADLAPGGGYSLLDAPLALDQAVADVRGLVPGILEMGEMEQGVWLLMAEIQHTRRRVNALEYVMIPNLRETIRYIQGKLDENERGNITRLMKIKEMRLREEREAMAARRAR